MSDRKNENPGAEDRTAKASDKRRFPAVLILLIGVGAALALSCSKPPGAESAPLAASEEPATVVRSGEPAPVVASVEPANRTAASVEIKGAFQELLGKWRRPDGGYVIDITGVDADGRMDAGYFNPHPIHVSRAEASMEEDVLQVFIELKDKGYPGSTYTLTYDAQRDALSGIYFQAALEQSFEVVFVRAE